MKGDKGMFYGLSSMLYAPAHTGVEFSGTLLGFDDYVSKLHLPLTSPYCMEVLIMLVDMVLNDVTELYGHPSFSHLSPLVEVLMIVQRLCHRFTNKDLEDSSKRK